MKNRTKHLLKSARLPSLVFSGLALCLQAHAGSLSLLVFTEVSDEVLTVTLGGAAFGTVTFNGKDNWTWQAPTGDTVAMPSLYLQWLEPGATLGGPPPEVNVLFPGSLSSINIRSDVGGSIPVPGTSIYANETVVLDSTLVSGVPLLVVANAGGSPLNAGVEFIDKGDAVPDVASTYSLLLIGGLALLAFGWAVPLQRVQNRSCS